MCQEDELRKAHIKRVTSETEISVDINLDGNGSYEIETGIGFFNHMLELFSKHSGIDIKLKMKGDIHIDFHHTVEDVGIVLGQAILQGLGDKKGINRYGFFMLPMDETLIECAVDLSGRSFLNYDVKFFADKVGGFDIELVEEFLKAFSDNLKANVHVIKRYGKNSHHIAEGIFKCLAKSIKTAIRVVDDSIPSTKGVI
ncbi:imidazoleglycerol-phosphate dehydratase HisB [Deferrivibrio essentukiensis]|jgi:imidazoleglycerol-phosphate dehydratase|uniref:imidazoleglycerol-phosphate dehydratase HisB n=1 Tax=Deferrivibrio essentukiensis TaxID=2880922 RepID=UPI003BF9BA7B|nr:Imidazoleglycerol-phosphate dehydratase [Deferribacteraceae bacterium]